MMGATENGFWVDAEKLRAQLRRDVWPALVARTHANLPLLGVLAVVGVASYSWILTDPPDSYWVVLLLALVFAGSVGFGLLAALAVLCEMRRRAIRKATRLDLSCAFALVAVGEGWRLAITDPTAGTLTLSSDSTTVTLRARDVDGLAFYDMEEVSRHE